MSNSGKNRHLRLPDGISADQIFLQKSFIHVERSINGRVASCLYHQE